MSAARKLRSLDVAELRIVDENHPDYWPRSAVVVVHRTDGVVAVVSVAEALDMIDCGEAEWIDDLDSHVERLRKAPPPNESPEQRFERENPRGSVLNPHRQPQPKPMATQDMTMTCGYCRRVNRVRLSATVTQMEDR